MQLVFLRLTLIPFLLFALTACGGGGNGTKSSPDPAPSSSASSSVAPLMTQNFAFNQVGPINLLAGDVLTNQAIGTGSGIVTYASSNTAVATVDDSGLVQVVGAGSAVITASKAADSRYLAATASYTIHAVSVSQTFSFAQTGEINLLAGDSLANPAIGQGSGAVTYHSSNPNVATVDSNGLVTVTVVGAGSTIITATKAADPHYYAASASYIINATGAAQTFSFAQPGPFSVLQNASFTNQATGQGSAPVIYSSSDTSVAVVDSMGHVNVVGAGSTIISATTAADSRYLSATRSYAIYSQAISLSIAGPVNGTVGGYLSNHVSTQGNGALTFSSNNTSVASVNSDGVMAFLGEGNAIITAAKAADLNYLAATISYTVNVTRNNQSITFSQTGPFNLIAGDKLDNQAAASGSGSITYSSSDTAIATVDNNGSVTVTGVGNVVITANVNADTRYFGATASYSINSGMAVTAWIGKNDTLVTFPAVANGFEFYRSTAMDCNFASYLSCSNGQMDQLTGSPIVDSTAQLNRTGYYFLKSGNQQAALSLKIDKTNPLNGVHGPFVNREEGEFVAFKNKIWMIGGYINDGINTIVHKNDIWSSANGIEWKQEIANAPFSGRHLHQLIVLNNKLWLLGGADAGSVLNDVWSSDDGINWIEQTNNTGVRLWLRNTFVAHNNKIWMIGSWDNIQDLPKNDVWSTTDGITWTKETANAAFSARRNHTVVVYNNKLWLFGGTNTNGILTDAWSSTDGITWIQETTFFAPPRINGAVVAYNNKLWLFGGSAANFKMNDIWSSANGATWTKHADSAPFSERKNHKVFIHDNQLLMLGGFYDETGIALDESVNQSWSSADGLEWRIGYKATFKTSP